MKNIQTKLFLASTAIVISLASCNSPSNKQENNHASENEIVDLSEWNLAWSDEFDYADEELEEKWISDNKSYEGFVLCSRWRENAEVHDGILELKAIKEQRGGNDWTCGNVWTKESFGYGYFECRYKYSGATGTNNSFWLWPKIGVDDGEKAFEIDINEGHYPNIVNTNIHNWTDKDSAGGHEQSFKSFWLEGKDALSPAISHEFEKPVKATKVRLKSNHHTTIHIGEFSIYAPNSTYPAIKRFENNNEGMEGLVNLSKEKGTKLSASGVYNDQIRRSELANVADGTQQAWISQIDGEKWLELAFDEEKEIGCIQFLNGWDDHGGNRNLLSEYTIEYYDGRNWNSLVEFDGHCENDFSEEFHTYGFEWPENEFKFYFDGELRRTESHTLCHAKTNILLSLAILSWDIAGPVTDDIDGTSMKVDYVRYYQPKE